jgi:1,4-alpha-glucan branching enzyme
MRRGPGTVRAVKRGGELAIVLHTHMPYVEGFGTWPFGEEWLWEAIATSYLPLLDVLGQAPLTLSLTPVLCDQLEAPGAMDRCLRFLSEVRPESHRLDIEALRDQPGLAAELERSAAEYAGAAERLAALPGSDLLGALGRHAAWTSTATHAVLPLLVSDSGIDLQVQTGIASHRRRFGDWAGGFWLPECAHAPWLDELLEEAGVRSTCVELTGCFGLGDDRHLQPLITEAGPVLWPVDRQSMALVWSERGYPSSPAYRDYHRLTPHHHRVWRNDGAAYDPEAAEAQVAEDARDFIARASRRLERGGLCVCAIDTELLGHWWYEGVRWLSAVIEEAGRQELALTTLDDALERHAPQPAPSGLPITSWGSGGVLATWSGPGVADIPWRARAAELRALAHHGRPGERALRELLALQSSDWAFLIASNSAGPYPRQRAHGHTETFQRALANPDALEPSLRSLAPELVGWEG